MKLYANFSGKPLHNFFIYIKFQLKNVIFILLPDKAKASARGWLPGQVVGLLSSGRGGYFLSQAEEPSRGAFSQAACQLSRLVVPVFRSQRMSTWAPAFSQAACQLSRLAAPVLRSQRMSTWTPVFSQAAFSQCYGLRSRLFSEAETDML